MTMDPAIARGERSHATDHEWKEEDMFDPSRRVALVMPTQWIERFPSRLEDSNVLLCWK